MERACPVAGCLNKVRAAPRGAAAIGVVFEAEPRVQQPLFGADASDQRREDEGCEQHADRRSEGEGPTQRVDEQPQIAGMADDTIDAARHQPMPGLDGDEPAEPAAEHKDRPEPQSTAGREEDDAEPANGFAVEGPEPFSVRIGRQIAGQQTDQREGGDDPTVRAILALAGAQIAATEERRAGQHEERNRQRDQGRVREERRQPAPAENGEPEIGKGSHYVCKSQSGCGHQSRLLR